jgi:hypothetical protein
VPTAAIRVESKRHSGAAVIRYWLLHHRLTCLLLAVLTALALLPFERAFSFFGYRLIMMLILGVGIYAVSHRRYYVLVGLLMGVPAVVLSLLLTFGYSSSVSTMTAQSLLQILFYVYTILILMNYLLRQTEVSMNTINGAICVYLLLGILWANAYTLVELYLPGSFSITRELGERSLESTAHIHTFSNLLYFSFTTISTVGFGDIVPLSEPARWLGAMEAIVGQTFLAVLIARLVGIHIGQAMKSGNDRK